MTNWHYANRGQRFGPVTEAEMLQLISNGTVTMDTLVWREGMSEWKIAREVAELRDLTAMAPAAGELGTRAAADGSTPPRAGFTPPTRPDGIVIPEGGAELGDRTGGVIPYKNPLALTSYYIGIFSLLPCIGVLLTIPAIICGILGLRAYKKQPAIRGVVHAWIGIGLAALSLLGHVAFAVIGSILN
jgi:hypothetical protein